MRILRFLIITITAIAIFVSCSSNTEKSNDTVSFIKTVKSFENGSPQIIQTFKNGKPVYQKEYHKDGYLSIEGPLKNNKRTGKWKSYYPDGTIWSEGTFKNGKSNGAFLIYYPNGKIKYKAFYANGEKTGIWTFFDETTGDTTNINFTGN